MTDRLTAKSFKTAEELLQIIADEMHALQATPFPSVAGNQRPTNNCVATLIANGAVTVIIQRRVQDPDFAAEFGAYYGRQFAAVSRWCARLHFFSAELQGGVGALSFLDSLAPAVYLGFITLRPVARAPIGASILSHQLAKGFLRSSDDFPVHLAGVALNVRGTPFMQQDNAVGACAQASIWMSLRTLRKREGDRAHDPAQITDAATKYFITGRVRPNRQGLTIDQMTEAVRAAGYSPHRIPLGQVNAGGIVALDGRQMAEARWKLHSYIESEIPVLLALFPRSGGHAVTAIGHTWVDRPAEDQIVTIQHVNGGGRALTFRHAVSYVPELIVHNDNTGPYQRLPQKAAEGQEYDLECAAFAIPLLPADVFMTGEEALEFGITFTSQIFDAWRLRAGDDAVEAAVAGLTVRLHLAEKRRLRAWATSVPMAAELKDVLRLADLPRRVWVFELHLTAHYGTHGSGQPATLVGAVLIDPTADALDASLILAHFNMPAIITGTPQGVLINFNTPAPTFIQTNDLGPLLPMRG